MFQDDESQNLNSIPDNKSSQPKRHNKIISHKCSLSVDITYDKNKVVTKIFKKLKIILKRPEPPKNILRSASPRKKTNKIYTYQKSLIKDRNTLYINKSNNSAKNRLKINKGKKYDINPININLSTFEIIKDKNKNKNNNMNININNICSLLIKILNNNITKSKQIFFNKIKYNNKVYYKKHIDSNNNNINNISQTVPNVLGYNKTKNFLEEINSENSNTFIYNNKSITNDDSFEGNITIISKPDIKKLDDSNSNEELGNNIDNNDNDENSIVNRNYSYDKKDMKEIISEQKKNIFKELKEELDNNSINKKIILSNKKNKINKESLLFSEGNILSINKSKSNLKEKEENYKIACKNNNTINNSNNINNSKINGTQFTSRNSKNKKRKLFIDSISFEKIEPNNLFESNKNNVENNKISYLNLNSNSMNNTYSEKNNANNISYLKNKNIKDCYENTCNSFEETTNINDYENNPINKNTLDEEKYLFNNSSMKYGNLDIINSKELIINNKNNFNNEENIIEKSVELEYYPINEIINNEEEYELDIKGKNASFFKHKIIDKNKNIIRFLFKEEKNNKANNSHPKLKAKISLNSYLNIIKKSLYKKKSDNNENEDKKENIEINKNNKMSFSISSYEEFIKQLIDEISINNYDKDNNYINNNNMLENDIDNFEDKIKNLKNSVLYLLVKKHYLNSMNDKLALISENNEIIDEKKKEIYNLFKKIKNNCKTYNINRVLDILKQNENISKRDIKIAKYNYKKEKKDERDENLINYGSLILPFFYIAKFLSTFNV